jgi:uncharacterized repeat protein (TIGR01451 family)
LQANILPGPPVDLCLRSFDATMRRIPVPKFRSIVISLSAVLLLSTIVSLAGFASPAKSDYFDPLPPTADQARSFATQPISTTNTIIEVVITEEGLSPETVIVAPGTTIRWINQTSQTQQLASAVATTEGDTSAIYLPLIMKNTGEGQAATGDKNQLTLSGNQTDSFWRSGDILPGDSFSRVFRQPGQYLYTRSGFSDLIGVVNIQTTPAPYSSEAMFVEVAESAGLKTAGNKNGGLSWGDFDQDNCLDVVVNTYNYDVRTRLYQQDKDDEQCTGKFEDVTESLAPGLLHHGKKERSAIWGDVNNDGYPDLAVNRFDLIEIYLNKGPQGTPAFGLGNPAGEPDQAIKSFSNPANSSCHYDYAFNTEAMGWIDYNNDSSLDLAVDNHNNGIIIFQNDGSGYFTDIDPTAVGLPGCQSARSGDYGAFTDFDADGDVDILIRKEDQFDLWVNDGTGNFAKNNSFNQQASDHNKGGAAFCDFDNDGDFDLFWTDHDTNQIWQQDPVGTFTPTHLPTGFTGNIDGVACADVDNDGDLDLFLTNEDSDFLFLNKTTDGTLSFEQDNRGITGVFDGEGTAFADYDRDGDLDLLINQDYRNELWRNKVDNNDYLIVRALLEIDETTTRDAIGATVSLLDCEDNIVGGIRDVNGGRGHGSQDPAFIHFGLPDGPDEPYVVKVQFVGGTTVKRAVVPAELGGYQAMEVKNTDDDDLTACRSEADLVVTKIDAVDPVILGEVVSYTITVTNTGPQPAKSVILTDTLPAAVTFGSATPADICSHTPGLVTCSLGDIDPGYQVSVTLAATTTASGLITNTVTAVSNTDDPDPTNNIDIKETTQVNPAIDLAVTKRDQPDPVPAGQPLIYTITLTNSGPAPATGIVVSDTLPAGVNFNAATSSPDCAEAGGLVTCAVTDLTATPPHNTTTVIIATMVDFSTAGQITNTVTVTAAELELNPGDNRATTDTTVLPGFLVTNTNDNGPGSLRRTLLNANAHPGADTITFDIPGAGPHIIQLASPLPVLTDSVTIDGTSQAGTTCDPLSPVVTIDGSALAIADADGLNISTGQSTVQGLSITGFSGDGLELSQNGGNLIQCNAISTNNGVGVHVAGGVGNTILSNRIFDNGQLGIDLGGDGVTPNDTKDPDSGANDLQNLPVVLRTSSEGGNTTIEGRLNSTPDTNFKLQFFSNSVCDPSQYGEGHTLLGTITQTTNITGDISFVTDFPIALPDGQFVTATATDPAGNTSEFSQCVPVGFDNDSWPRALRLPVLENSPFPATADQYIDKPGQSRWYKFTVEPNSKVIVTLTNLPENYDLFVFKDIAQAFEELNSSQDLLQLSTEFSPGSFSPGSFSPGSFSPGSFSPGSFSPDAFAPGSFSPGSFSPGSFSPGSFSPDVYAPGSFSPGSFSPGSFSPGSFSPGSFSPGSFSPGSFSPGSFSPGSFSPGSFSPGSFSSAQTRSLIGLSTFEGRAGEGIILNTWNNSSDFYILVQGRNGAFSLASPFHLEAAILTGSCEGVNPITEPSSLTPTAGNYRTIILTDLNRMTATAAERTALQARLADLAARPEVAGVVVDVGADARVAAANVQADPPNFVECPYAKNLVAGTIKEIIDGYRDLNPLEYIVIIGNDNVIPFFRHPDQALLGNEMNYVPPVADFTASQASLRLGYTLSQDRYGAERDISVGNDTVPFPDLAVGRLVETPTEILTILDAYLGTPDGVVPTPTSSLVTGYDFLEDAARAVQAELVAGLGDTAGVVNDSLIAAQDLAPELGWSADDLAALFLNNRYDLAFLAGHFSANSALAADFSTNLLTTDLVASPVDMTNAIIYSAGCHSGYNIVNKHDIPFVTFEPDWAQAINGRGATLIAGTGYQYGDTDFLEYSERLYLDFTRQLRTGTGPVSIGQAMVAAKQKYLQGTPVLRGIHEKALLEATIFGLPMLSVDMPGQRLTPTGEASIVGGTTSFSTDPGATLGLRSADVTVTPNLSLRAIDLEADDGSGQITANWFAGSDGVVSNPTEPVLPLEIENVTLPDMVLRGVGFLGGDYTDLADILPLTNAPATENRGVHAPFFTPVFFPIQPWHVNYFDALGSPGGATNLAVMPAQFISNPLDPESGTLRRFDTMRVRLYYSNNIDTFGGDSTPALAAAPSIGGVSAFSDGVNVNFTANVVGNPAAGIQEVLVIYTATSGPLAGTWQSFNLTQQVDGESTVWAGTLPLTGSAARDIRFMVQAVNGVGLVTLDTKLGEYYRPDDQALPGQPTALSLQVPANSGPYGSATTAQAVLTTAAGQPLAGQMVVFRLGSQTRVATTNASGQANATLPLRDLPGDYDVSASFTGTAQFESSTDAETFTITKANTQLELEPLSASGHAEEENLMMATLTDAAGQTLIERQTVFFVIAGAGTFPVVTDPAGQAFLGELPLPPGVYSVVAYFNGAIPDSNGNTLTTLTDPRYNPAISAAGSLTLLNHPPVAMDDSYTTPEDTPLNVAAPGVLTNDSDVDDDPLMAKLVSPPGSGHLTLELDGSFTYTPAPDFHGSVSFTYQADDGTDLSNTATVTLTITPVNDAPTAQDDAYEVDEGQTLTVPAPGVLDNDNDVDGDALSATLVTGPANGTVTLDPDGGFTYTPNPHFDEVDTFTYQATDGDLNSNVATVTITVNPVVLDVCGFGFHTLEVFTDATVDCGLAANGDVHLKNQAKVTGDVFSAERNVNLNKEVNVEGSVAAGDDIDLQKDVVVTGDVTAGGFAKVGPGVIIGGTITEQTGTGPFAPLAPPDLDLTAGTQDITLNKNETLALAPGSYGRLKVKEEATLILSAGEYAFKQFDLDKDATLQLDIADGSIVIDVVQQLFMGENVTMTGTGSPENILFRVQGSRATLHKEGQFLGTFLVPQGTVSLNSKATLTGALYGQLVKIGSDTHVTGAPAIDLNTP